MTTEAGNGREPARIHVAIGPSLRSRLFVPSTAGALLALGEVEFQETDRRPAETELAARLRGCRVVVTGWGTPRLTPAVLAAAPELELVAHTGSSVWAQVDELFFRSGGRVTSTGDAMAIPVAEFTLMQILRALRFPGGAAGTGEKKPGNVPELPPGTELAGCVVGVVGAGRIGRRVIRLLRAFEASVLLHDPFLPDAEAAALGAAPVGLPDLLRAARVVTLHAAAVPAARGMIGAAELAAMPDGAWLINTARAALVDTAALTRELKSGRISAALDVFDVEPLPADSPLRGLANVVATPHCAFNTRECLHRLGAAAVEEVRRFLGGEPGRNQVTLDVRDRMA